MNPVQQMSGRWSLIVIVLFAFAGPIACAQGPDICPGESGVALQVLGSGGPIADDGRASSSYLVWVDGKSRVMIDAGGGSFLRFGEAGGRFTDLDFIGISHFHADHSADFPALLKSGNFAGRKRALVVAGPGAGGPFPGLGQFVDALFNSERGAFSYLSGYLDGTDNLPRIDRREVTDSGGLQRPIFESDIGPLMVSAMHVPHGIVPALGFRVRVDDVNLVFSSDQNGSNAAFIDFATNADILVMHMPIPEGATGVARQLHAPPGVIGEIASAAGVRSLLVSHFMARSLRDLDGNLAAITEAYDGRLLVAEDLRCIMVN